MAFQQALSGLNTAGKAIDVTSHNIANSSTVGYKASVAHFSDVYARSLNGSGANQVGIGVNLSGIAQQFTQGNITTTNNPLDISINGNGFFRMEKGGELTYTRSGQFHLDKNGYIVNDQNMRLTGYPSVNGSIVPATPAAIQVSASDIPPVATEGIRANLSLDSREKKPDEPWVDGGSQLEIAASGAREAVRAAILTGSTATPAAANAAATAAYAAVMAAADPAAEVTSQIAAAVAAAVADGAAATTAQERADVAQADAIHKGYNPTANPETYNWSTGLDVYDTLGNPHRLTLYFIKGDNPREWGVVASVDGTSNAFAGLTGGASVTVGGVPMPGITFDENGKLTNGSGTTAMNLSINLNAVMEGLGSVNSADNPLAFDLDFLGTTQTGKKFGNNRLEQDGYAAGSLTSLGVGTDGTILGNYSNGESFALGQVVLANFTNPNGLRSQGNNQWIVTSESGPPLLGAPESGNLGLLSASTVEESNVDLTQELVNLITNQRNYQANAQSVKTQDQIMQTLVNLR